MTTTTITDEDITTRIAEYRDKYLSFRRDAAGSFVIHDADARDRLWHTWFPVTGQHRDSDVLSVSNFATISADMSTRFVDDVETHSFSHFAVGWVEECFVRYLDDEGDITDAARAAEVWRDKLSDYPVADEEDYSRREYEDLCETLELCYNVPTDRVSDVIEQLESYSADDLSGDDVDAIMADLGISEDS